MSNLIPVPRTDKNGRVVTRHMKPETGASRLVRAVPRVGVAAPVVERILTREELLELVFPDGYPAPFEEDAEAIERAAEFLNQHSPDVFPAVVEMLSSGAEGSRADVRRRVQGTVASLAQAMGSRLPGESDERFLRSVSFFMHSAKPGKLRQYWNCGNVLEESGFASDATVQGRLDNIVSQEFKRELPKLDPDDQGNAFWRGATAYTIVDLFPSVDDDMTARERHSVVREFYGNSKKFIDYAGKHKDIGLVIRIAKERRTLVVRDIREIIARGKKTPALADGVL